MQVGGLPLQELNLLELQFLLLNDFRLVISGKEMQHYAEQLIRFSHAGTNGHARVSPAPRIHSRPLSPTAPMRAMGALDADVGAPYAREFTASSRPQPPAHTTRSISTTQRRNAYPPASDTALQYTPFTSAGSTTPGGSVANNKTPSVRPRRPSYVDDEEPEPGTDTENETEAGTETDSGETTDDEPTIRPPHSSASSETDNRSLCSTSTFESEGEDEDEEGEANEMAVEVEMGVNGESGAEGQLSDEDDGKRNDGDLTPERPGKGWRGGDGDVDVDDHRMASP
jgi:PHO85 cyclin-6/7